MFINLRKKIATIICPELSIERRAFERAANFDFLTDLPNRRAFDLAQPAAETEGLGFVFFDANSFGKINKLYSHERGNEVLQTIGAVMAEVSRKFKCRAFRYAGDEMVIICQPKFAEQIRDAVEKRFKPIVFEGFTVSISGEIGKTIAEADSKLQARKAARKNELDFQRNNNAVGNLPEIFAF